jgi:hypothetical protein
MSPFTPLKLKVFVLALLLLSVSACSPKPPPPTSSSTGTWAVSGDMNGTEIAIGVNDIYRISNTSSNSVEVHVDGNRSTVITPGNSTDIQVFGGRLELKAIDGEKSSGTYEKLNQVKEE